jgi:hypothetical protein
MFVVNFGMLDESGRRLGLGAGDIVFSVGGFLDFT